MRNVVMMTVALLLVSTGMAFAAVNVDDDAKRDPLDDVNCDWIDTDHGRANICTCSGTDQCDALEGSGLCDRAVTGSDGTIHTVNDYGCPQEYQDRGELVCQCTSITRLERPGVSTRPDSYSSSTENAPANMTPRPTNSEPANFSAPTGLRITNVGSDRLRFTWQDNSNNEDGFVIERLLPMTSATAPIATVRGAGTTMGSRTETVRIRGARNTFCYQVRATRGSIRTEPTERACAALN